MNDKINISLKAEIEKIINLYKKKNFKLAFDQCNILIEKNGDIPFLLNLNGLINLSLENWQDALNCFKKTLKNNDKFFEAYNNLGVTYSHLGNYEGAIKNFNKAIELNNNYANAYNNLGSHYDDFGNYSLASEYYIKALKCNSNHPNAIKNLIHLFNYHKIDNLDGNLIVDLNKKILNFNPKINLKDKISTSEICIFIKDSIDLLKENSIKIDSTESQIYRTNGKNLNCNRHKEVFFKYKIIPEFCYGCLKVQIELKNVLQLIKVFFIFDHVELPQNNIRKCFIEFRENEKENYKALIYCSDINDANNVYKIISEILNISLKNFTIKIKRGCSEFDSAFPGYKDISKMDKIIYNKDWKKKEKLIDVKIAKGSQKGKKYFAKSMNGINLGDILIINNWLNYAKIIGDVSYKKITSNLIHVNHISVALKNIPKNLINNI